MTRKLKDHPYAQARVEIDDGIMVLYSYVTPVIICERVYMPYEKWAIYCTGTYSTTTRKHIGYFLKEYFPGLCYYDMKSIAGTGEAFIIN